MAGKKSKKKTDDKPSAAEPMPSLIFSEGVISEPSPTPKADLVEKELLDTRKKPSLEHLNSYDPSARKLMWFAVVSLTLVVCVMWSWSIYSQLSSIDWKKVSENNLLEDTKQNWKNSFQNDEGKRISAEQQITNIKSNLEKLFAGAAASSSPATSTPEVTSSTP